MLAGKSFPEQTAIIEQAAEVAYQASDLGQPFILRSFRYFRDAMSLKLGEARYLMSKRGSKMVLDILWEKLPLTLLLFWVSAAISFLGALFIALSLSRRYGSVVDRVTSLLIPVLAAPPWFHGVILVVIFASLLNILPFAGLVGTPLPQTTIGYILSVLKHMILPVTACVLGTMPVAIYANRSLFMIHSREDYVELAKAKGVGETRLQRLYILRPVLPAIITNFAFVAIVAWQQVVLTENIFSWPGLGLLLLKAIGMHETAIVTGVVTIFAYLLGVSVLFLDILYVLADPRVRLGSGGAK